MLPLKLVQTNWCRAGFRRWFQVPRCILGIPFLSNNQLPTTQRYPCPAGSSRAARVSSSCAWMVCCKNNIYIYICILGRPPHLAQQVEICQVKNKAWIGKPSPFCFGILGPSLRPFLDVTLAWGWPGINAAQDRTRGRYGPPHAVSLTKKKQTVCRCELFLHICRLRPDASTEGRGRK